MNDHVGEVVAENEGSATVQIRGTGERVSALIAMFPPGITPRVGDLVTVGQGALSAAATSPLCAPTGGGPIAVPLATWTIGIPSISSGVVIHGGLTLVPSPDVVAAAEQRQAIRVHSLDTTLQDHQVLAVRSVLG